MDRSVSFGTFIDYAHSDRLVYEFLWNRSLSAITQHDFTVNQSFKAYNADIDQYQFGVLINLLDPGRKLRPYVAGGVGFTHSNNSNATGDTAFSFNLGGGAKYYLSRHFGLRADLRLMPTYANSIQGQICDPYYGCYYGTQRNFFKRLNAAGGVVFRF